MILFLTQTFPPAVGGMESLSFNLVRTWTADGREAAVFADSRGLPGEREFDKEQIFAIRRFGGPRPLRRWRKGRAAALFVAKNPVDAVFADSWKSVPPGWTEKTPIFCLAHGNELLSVRPNKAQRRKKALLQAHAVVANSRFTANLVRGLIHDAVPIEVIPPGVGGEPRRDDSDTQNALHRQRLLELTGGARPLLVTVSRLEPRKGVDKVIQALPALRDKHPRIAYLVAGDGRDRERLEGMAREAGVADRVFFTGHLAEEEKSAALSLGDLFAMPNRRAGNSVEGFGMAFLEAALRGAPSVAGRDGGVVDAVTDGETGWLCDGADAQAVLETLTAALADHGELARRGAAAKARAEKAFAWEAVARRHLALVEAAEGTG